MGCTSLIILIAYSISVHWWSRKSKTLILIPILISTSEIWLVTGIVGAIIGLLIDLSCDKLFGFNGIL